MDSALLILWIVTFFVFFITSCLKTTKVIFVTPIFAFLVFNLLFIFPNYFSYGFDSLYFYVTYLGMLSFLFIYSVFSYKESTFQIPYIGWRKGLVFYISVLSFLIVLTFCFWVYSYSIMGISVSELLLNPIKYTGVKGKSNIFVDFTVNSIIANLINYYLLCLLFRNGVPSKKDLILVLTFKILALFATFTTGRFIYIAHTAVFALLYILAQNRNYNALKQLVMMVVVFVFAPIILYILNIARHGYWDVFSDFSVLDAYVALTADLNPGRKLNDLINYVQGHGYNFGVYILFIVLNIIPRAIWPDKPVISSQFDYTQKIYGIDPIVDITTYTFTIYDVYAVFGFPSLIMFLCFFGFIFAKFYSWIFRSTVLYYKYFFLMYCLNSINAFRANMIDSLFLTVLNFTIGIIIFGSLNYVHRKNRI